MVTVARWWSTRLVSLLGFPMFRVCRQDLLLSQVCGFVCVCVFICVRVGTRRVGFLRGRQTEKNKKKRGFSRREKHLKLRLEICNLSLWWRGLLRWALTVSHHAKSYQNKCVLKRSFSCWSYRKAYAGARARLAYNDTPVPVLTGARGRRRLLCEWCDSLLCLAGWLLSSRGKTSVFALITLSTQTDVVDGPVWFGLLLKGGVVNSLSLDRLFSY